MSLHHWSTIQAYGSKLERWKAHTDEAVPGEKIQVHSSNHNRCGTCWLRHHQCYCKTANVRRDYYQPKLDTEYSNCEIIMYYHYMEIGRSANTAHFFQMLCPSITSTLMFGDVENETKLFDAMKAEAESGEGLRTCILYPGTTAVLMHDWIAEQEEKDRRASATRSSSRFWAHNPQRKYRLIALDGTYGQANKLMKHIENTLTGKLGERGMRKLQGLQLDETAGDSDANEFQELHEGLNRFKHNGGKKGCKAAVVRPDNIPEMPFYVPNYNIPVPVVKLYLGPSGGCKSAIAGIMYQPRIDTLCTFQVYYFLVVCCLSV